MFISAHVHIHYFFVSTKWYYALFSHLSPTWLAPSWQFHDMLSWYLKWFDLRIRGLTLTSTFLYESLTSGWCEDYGGGISITAWHIRRTCMHRSEKLQHNGPRCLHSSCLPIHLIIHCLHSTDDSSKLITIVLLLMSSAQFKLKIYLVCIAWLIVSFPLNSHNSHYT